MQGLHEKLRVNALKIEEFLAKTLSNYPASGEFERPHLLMAAMRHSALDGGKRLRPFLLIETGCIGGIAPEQSIAAATALELIHCYSLVHDDLPAMDDDDLRRGKPTTHKAFDEATAILAGDGLLTLAFHVLAQPATHMDPAIRIELVSLYASAAGIGGMVGGQMLDLDAETSTPDEAGIKTLQAMKTGALIRLACEAGAVISHMASKERKALVDYGLACGQAFQLADDILDATSDAKTMGKATEKDAKRGKGTLVAIHGLDKARAMAAQLSDQAIAALDCFGKEAHILRDTAHFIVGRKS